MSTKIPVVYIAGKFRGPEFNDVQRYIDVASWFRAPIAKLKCFPVCVHIGEGLAMHDLNQENNGQWWIESTLEVLRRCDAVVVVPGWQTSSGTFGEVQEALRLGKPVFQANWFGMQSSHAMPKLTPPEMWPQGDTLEGEVGFCWLLAKQIGLKNFAAWVAEVTK